MEFLKTKRFRIFIFKKNFILFFFWGGKEFGSCKGKWKFCCFFFVLFPDRSFPRVSFSN